MNVNIIMWIGGMGVVLAAFAFKLAIGFYSGKPRTRWIVTLLAGYLGLFVLAALLSGEMAKVLELLLREGPYLHMALAGGMILWGLWLVVGKRTRTRKQAGHGDGNGLLPVPALPLVLPCPVCLSAIAFSVCAVVAALRLPPLVVGLCLGGAFVVTSLAVLFLLGKRKDVAPAAPLGLAMIVIGLYFVLSLAIPAKIEEAKGMYASFLMEHQAVDIQNTLGALGILAAMMLVGYCAKKQR